MRERTNLRGAGSSANAAAAVPRPAEPASLSEHLQYRIDELGRPSLQVTRLRRWVVALPAKNESQRLAGAIAALDKAAGHSRADVAVLVFANDCLDDTAEVARQAGRSADFVKIAVQSMCLPPGRAHAGGARRMAARLALHRFQASRADLLFTTDADARLHVDALARMEAVFDVGADIVLAKIACVRDPFEPACEAALRWGSLRSNWRHRVRQLVEMVRTGATPNPPLHDDYGGAGIAATVAAYHQLGGFPSIPSDEDLQFVQAADRAGLYVDRQSGATVDVFTRTVGRASGGMASDIASCTAAVADGLACLVEHHELTTQRIFRNPTHAAAFTENVTEWESAEDAIRALDAVIARLKLGDRPMLTG